MSGSFSFCRFRVVQFFFGKYMIHTPETGVLVSIASALLGALFGLLLVLVDASITATVWIPLLLFANERVFTIVTIFGFQLVAWYVFLSSRGNDFFREDWVLILAIAFFCAIVTCLVYRRHHFYRLAIKLKE